MKPRPRSEGGSPSVFWASVEVVMILLMLASLKLLMMRFGA